MRQILVFNAINTIFTDIALRISNYDINSYMIYYKIPFKHFLMTPLGLYILSEMKRSVPYYHHHSFLLLNTSYSQTCLM